MFKHFSKALLRTPLLSLNALNNFSLDKELPKLFIEGILLSSSILFDQYIKLKASGLDERERSRMESTISKYWKRSCTRSTPYGTFAGCSLITASNDANDVILASHEEYQKFVRLDMDVVTEIFTSLMKIPEIRSKMKYFPNNSIYNIGESIRYIEYYISGGKRVYNLSSAENSAYLRSVLMWCKDGISCHELSYKIAKEFSVEYSDAENYVLDLYEAQIVVSELEPPVTGTDPLIHIISTLKKCQINNTTLISLLEIQSLIEKSTNKISAYQKISELLQQFNPHTLSDRNIVQTDMFKPIAGGSMSLSMLDIITSQVVQLGSLGRKLRNPVMDNFISSFEKKFEGKEVPLSLALDADMGINYGTSDSWGSEYINNLATRSQQPIADETIDKLNEFIYKKYNDYVSNGLEKITINEQELVGSFNLDDNLLPNSMFILGSIIKKKNEEFIFDLAGFSGQTSSMLLGRFTAGDSSIEEFSKHLIEEESNQLGDNAIFAEIIHLPQSRMGNIILRPVLRKYEIPYVGISGTAKDFQISLDDLMLSVRNGKPFLRSIRLGKEVIPRLTTAHNFSFNSLPVYRFLCDMQGYSTKFAAIWDWGYLSQQSFLPRVEFKNIVLAKATWKIKDSMLHSKRDDNESDFEKFKQLLILHNVPKQVLLMEGDNELLIDTSLKTDIVQLINILRKKKAIVLTEFLFDKMNSFVKDGAGQVYANEVIIPVHKIFKQHKIVPNPAFTAKIKDKFCLGSEWLYFKIYCGYGSAENLLINTILPFVEKGISNKWFEHFFFIRYNDDFPHLRIRFYNSNTDLQFVLQKEFMSYLNPAINQGIIGKVQIDEYAREIERYGGASIVEVEKLFFNDSLTTLKALACVPEIDPKGRILFAVKNIDILLNDFDLTNKERYDLIKSMQESFYQEFGGGKTLQKQLNNVFRDLRTELRELIIEGRHLEENIISLFKKRTALNLDSIRKIGGELDRDYIVFTMLPSIVHMLMNRIFLAKQRKQELLVYHLMERNYLTLMKFSSSVKHV